MILLDWALFAFQLFAAAYLVCALIGLFRACWDEC